MPSGKTPPRLSPPMFTNQYSTRLSRRKLATRVTFSGPVGVETNALSSQTPLAERFSEVILSVSCFLLESGGVSELGFQRSDKRIVRSKSSMESLDRLVDSETK
ncbi:hypothetical protein ABW21_db0202058 [Orbilia brochopaga]|nr:hypothetical protein ABW21_db0202058 [Drechslerella brochopaga]